MQTQNDLIIEAAHKLVQTWSANAAATDRMVVKRMTNRVAELGYRLAGNSDPWKDNA